MTESLPEDVEKLLIDLSTGSLVYHREKAADKLSKLLESNERIVDMLIAAVEDRDARVGQAAVQALRAPIHRAILEQRGLDVETFWRHVYPPRVCARCRAINANRRGNCVECGFPLGIKPTTSSIFAIWVDVLADLLWTAKSESWVDCSSESFFTSLTLEPNPLGRAVLGLLSAVIAPFGLLALIVGPQVVFTPFIQNLAATLIIFFLGAGITYGYSRLLGGRENFSVHTYLLSLIYAPITLISLSLNFLLLVFFGEDVLSCLYIIGWGLGILFLILAIRVLRYGQQLSKWRAILVTVMSLGTAFTIAIGISISLVVWSKVTGIPLDALMIYAQGEQVQEQSQSSQRATATRQARIERSATATAIQATVEAHTIGRTLPRQQDLQSASFSPNGQEFVTAGQAVTIWDIPTLKAKATLSGHNALVTGVNYSPDGRKLATSDEMGMVKMWDTQIWQEIWAASGVQRGYTTVAFSPDGQKIVVRIGSNFTVFEAQTGKQIYAVNYSKYRGRLINAAYSPDGRYIMAVFKGDNNWDMDGLLMWDAQTGQEVADFGWGHANSIQSARYSPDGQYILLAKTRGVVEIWDTQTLSSTFTFQAQRFLDYAAYSPDGRNIITGGERIAKVWQAATSQEIATLVHQDDVLLALYSPDGQYIITITRDDIPVIWETRFLQEGGNFFVGP